MSRVHSSSSSESESDASTVSDEYYSVVAERCEDDMKSHMEAQVECKNDEEIFSVLVVDADEVNSRSDSDYDDEATEVLVRRFSVAATITVQSEEKSK